jgi:hypothetical protein
MKSSAGGEPTQTPPKPTSRPLMKLRLSANTVRLSNLPSPSVSSKMRIVSFPEGFQGPPGPV